MKNLQTGFLKSYVSFHSSSLLPSFLWMESLPLMLLCCYHNFHSLPRQIKGQNITCWDFLTQSQGFFHLPIFLLQSRKWMWIHCTKIKRLKKPPDFEFFTSFLHHSLVNKILTDYQTLTYFSSLDAETAFRAELLHELRTAVADSPTWKLLSGLTVNSSHFTAYRNLSLLLFPDGEVVPLIKHISLLPLMYGKLEWTSFENQSTGTTIAKGCTCPDCFIFKLTSD